MPARVLIFYVIPKITVHILICVVIVEIRYTHFIFCQCLHDCGIAAFNRAVCLRNNESKKLREHVKRREPAASSSPSWPVRTRGPSQAESVHVCWKR